MPPDPSQPMSSQLQFASERVFDPIDNTEMVRKRNRSSVASFRSSENGQPAQTDKATSQVNVIFPTLTPGLLSYESIETPLPTPTPVTTSAKHRSRRASAAEKVLEQLRSRDVQRSSATTLTNHRSSWLSFQQHDPVPASTTTATAITTTATNTKSNASVSSAMTVGPTTNFHESPTKGQTGVRSDTSRRLSLTMPAGPPPSPVLSKTTLPSSRHNHPSRSTSIVLPNQPILGQTPAGASGMAGPAIPPGLIPLLDGDHHTDELSVRFEAGWPLLEQWLIAIGGGKGDGDYGRVVIIYR